MLPNDLKDYQAPTFWRLHRDKLWMGAAAVLWIWAMFIPQNTQSAKPQTMEAATLGNVYCPRLRDDQPLRLMVKQRNYLGFEWHQCFYGAIERRDIF